MGKPLDRQDGTHRASDSGAFNGKPVMELLSQPGCAGLRIYHGRGTAGETALILVGVDAKGNDMTEGLLLDGHMPCPPFCGDDNALNS